MKTAIPVVGRAACVALSLLAAPHAESAERVDLELITEPGLPVNGAQRWLASLKDVPFSSVRIRSANPGDQVEVRQRGGADARSYQVIGLLTERNTLTLPGGEFRMGDTAGLRPGWPRSKRAAKRGCKRRRARSA